MRGWEWYQPRTRRSSFASVDIFSATSVASESVWGRISTRSGHRPGRARLRQECIFATFPCSFSTNWKSTIKLIRYFQGKTQRKQDLPSRSWGPSLRTGSSFRHASKRHTPRRVPSRRLSTPYLHRWTHKTHPFQRKPNTDQQSEPGKSESSSENENEEKLESEYGMTSSGLQAHSVHSCPRKQCYPTSISKNAKSFQNIQLAFNVGCTRTYTQANTFQYGQKDLITLKIQQTIESFTKGKLQHCQRIPTPAFQRTATLPS